MCVEKSVYSGNGWFEYYPSELQSNKENEETIENVIDWRDFL